MRSEVPHSCMPPRLTAAACCTGTPTSSTDVKGAEPLGGSLAAVAKQLWLYSISGISLWPVTAVPDPGGLQGLHQSELSREGGRQHPHRQLYSQQGMNKTVVFRKHLPIFNLQKWAPLASECKAIFNRKKELEVPLRQQKSSDTCFCPSPELSPAAPLTGEARMPWEPRMINWNNFA